MCRKRLKSSESEVERNNFVKIICVAVLGSAILCCVGLYVSYSIVDCFPNNKDLAELRGLFGDSWGGVNTLISALAFAGVIITLYLQNSDLKLQRQEMKEQRKEFEKENETLKYQRFENLFYNMLNLQQKIVDGLKEDDSKTDVGNVSGEKYIGRTVVGREVFRYMFEERLFKMDSNNTAKGFRDFLFKCGLKGYDSHWEITIFDHYFRHLYKIIQFVDSCDFSYDKAYMYISFLRSTLSRHELIWIYYNSLKYNKLKSLVEKYSILKNLRPELLALSKESHECYNRHGIKAKDIKEHGFSSKDFEFYLTDNSDNDSKFYLSAFWNKNELKTGQELYENWKKYIDSWTD